MSYISSYFNSNILYEEFGGHTGNSEVSGVSVQIKGRIEPSNKIVKSIDGSDILTTTVIYTKHDVKRGSYVTFGGDRIQVALVKPNYDLLGNLVFNEVYLG